MKEFIKIGNRKVGPGQPIFITAECGAAYDGDVELALDLVHAAADAGADAVEFFMCDPELFLMHGTGLEQVERSRKNWARFVLSDDEWMRIVETAKKRDLLYYWTCLDESSVDRAERLGCCMYNVNHSDTTNPFVLEKVSGKGKPVSVHDIDKPLGVVEFAYETLIGNGCEEVILLHSTNETDDVEKRIDSVRLDVIDAYRAAFTSFVGVVNHTHYLANAIAMAARKVIFISQHLTMNRDDKLADWPTSMHPDEFANMVKQLREVERMHGERKLNVKLQEFEPAFNHKHLCSSRELKAGEVITKDMLHARRPGTLGGISPMDYSKILGLKLVCDIPAGGLIRLRDLQGA